MADVLPATIDLRCLALDDTDFVCGPDSDHVVSLGLQLSRLDEHFLGSLFELFIAGKLKHAQLSARRNHFLHRLSVDLLEEADSETLLQIRARWVDASLNIFDLLARMLVNGDAGTSGSRLL